MLLSAPIAQCQASKDEGHGEDGTTETIFPFVQSHMSSTPSVASQSTSLQTTPQPLHALDLQFPPNHFDTVAYFKGRYPVILVSSGLPPFQVTTVAEIRF